MKRHFNDAESMLTALRYKEALTLCSTEKQVRSLAQAVNDYMDSNYEAEQTIISKVKEQLHLEFSSILEEMKMKNKTLQEQTSVQTEKPKQVQEPLSTKEEILQGLEMLNNGIPFRDYLGRLSNEWGINSYKNECLRKVNTSTLSKDVKEELQELITKECEKRLQEVFSAQQ